MGAGHREVGLERARHRAIQRVVHERGLPRARHAADDRQGAERNSQRHAFEVVLGGASQHEVTPG